MTQQKIKAVKTEGTSVLNIAWHTGRQTRVDIAEYFDSPGHDRLRDPQFFAGASVEEWGHGIEWADGEIGIGADALYRLGKEQAGAAFPVSEFNAWIERNGLSLTAAAKALGLTRRTVVYYHGGHKPIPIYIKLACLGWEVLQSRKAA